MKNNFGKSPYEEQTTEIRETIDKALLFCNRFEITSVEFPSHATFTSVVLSGTDKRAAEHSTASEVVLKVRARHA